MPQGFTHGFFSKVSLGIALEVPLVIPLGFSLGIPLAVPLGFFFKNCTENFSRDFAAHTTTSSFDSFCRSSTGKSSKIPTESLPWKIRGGDSSRNSFKNFWKNSCNFFQKFLKEILPQVHSEISLRILPGISIEVTPWVCLIVIPRILLKVLILSFFYWKFSNISSIACPGNFPEVFSRILPELHPWVVLQEFLATFSRQFLQKIFKRSFTCFSKCLQNKFLKKMLWEFF